ncbi:hypothetical protein AQUCO_01600356v1 [Aquilegia coerulea]|uniref:Dynamin-type G domain-containing protein n=1 Tax=Aquilegia coerulea TaxID=218851 RepID=A0A2G5DR98_AQUCA|nr:hypothetical protein AQUCO_01600356v1 [Aquilegia coerulea]
MLTPTRVPSSLLNTAIFNKKSPSPPSCQSRIPSLSHSFETLFSTTQTCCCSSSSSSCRSIVKTLAKSSEMEEESRNKTKLLPTIGSSVIPIVNKLQDIFEPFSDLVSKIKLPEVAVIGSQSSGKSSVLEALVGRDFLPRSSDICTRRPLILQLENRTKTSHNQYEYDDGREYGEFLHLPNKRFYDFSAIRREIQAETEREAGANKGVSDKKIRLKISSPNVLDITLVDLPGITKVPIGDQPTDIEAKIRAMIMSYIKHETCIILAVTPANTDLATSDALQMAKSADPAGSRTIGVITKLDIMDKGTDACNVLLGRAVPLKLGYIGIINRCQADINQNRSIAEALASEDKFFRSHPVYHGLLDRCGLPQLAKKLNLILEQHIRAVLPGLKAKLNIQMAAVIKELKTVGEVMGSKAEQGSVLLHILSKYCEGNLACEFQSSANSSVHSFSSLVDGKLQEMSTTELIGGARIHYIFQSIFVKRLEEVDPCDGLNDEDIRTAIQNATGPKNAIFVPEIPFEVLVRKQIARLLDPSLKCLYFVYDELIKMNRACESTEIPRFPVLKKRMDEVLGKFLRDGVKPAERMIGNIIEMEMDYINTSHPNFIGGSKAVEVAMQQVRSSKASQPRSSTDRPTSADNSAGRSWGNVSSIFGVRESRMPSSASPTKPSTESGSDIEQTSVILLREPPSILRPSENQTEQEAVEIVLVKLLLNSYYDIVRKNIQDCVPKAIMYFLVNHTKRELLATFIKNLYRENLFEEMLQEQEEVATQRKRTRDMFQILQLAVQTLEDVESEVVAASKR